MVGHTALDRGIGVRVPVSQLISKTNPFSEIPEGFSVCDTKSSPVLSAVRTHFTSLI